ncbi:hypothetical protein GCM10011610_03900 [Nocardia rhizosphaerihabitans]|uniref:Uncharacterized protein n=1 Tax=Nocardia rhizosphaerihabitans TaxID=1691570 RepID=A0ABQ2K6D2_9NOCA|nr:hypothetical protein GCM10011610_03900 [Nocardia rhizosphaerihabitans]
MTSTGTSVSRTLAETVAGESARTSVPRVNTTPLSKQTRQNKAVTGVRAARRFIRPSMLVRLRCVHGVRHPFGTLPACP